MRRHRPNPGLHVRIGNFWPLFKQYSWQICGVSFAFEMPQSEYRKVQKHSHKSTLLVTIPIAFAEVISITPHDVVKMTMENNRITMEKA